MYSSSQVENSSPPCVMASFEIPVGELDELEKLAERRQTSTTDVVRAAIARERLLAQQPDGSSVWIQTPAGEWRRVGNRSAATVSAASLARLRTERSSYSSPTEP
jgi:hypothetical protein